MSAPPSCGHESLKHSRGRCFCVRALIVAALIFAGCVTSPVETTPSQTARQSVHLGTMNVTAISTPCVNDSGRTCYPYYKNTFFNVEVEGGAMRGLATVVWVPTDPAANEMVLRFGIFTSHGWATTATASGTSPLSMEIPRHLVSEPRRYWFDILPAREGVTNEQHASIEFVIEYP